MKIQGLERKNQNIFLGDMIMFIENLTDKLLGLISEFIKASGFMVNV